MMRPVHFTVTTSGVSTPIPLDRYVNGYAIGVTLDPAAPTTKINYTVQYSMLDPAGPYSNSYAVSGKWQNMDDPVMVGQSAARTSNFAFPPMAVRLNVSAFSAGTATLHIIPMGMW